MRHQLLFVLLVLASFVSCKIEQDPKRRSEGVFLFPNMSNATERLMTADEVVITKRICSALKKKRIYFETLTNNTHSFSAVYSLKNCTQNTLSAERTFVVTLDNSNPIDMEFRTKDIDFNFKDVLTDQSPFLKNLCENLDKDAAKVANTVRSNLVVYTFTAKTVNKGVSYDRLEIVKRVPAKVGNELVIQSGESYEFYTKLAQAEEKFMGLEVFKERFGTCENPDLFSVYKETFTKPLTSF